MQHSRDTALMRNKPSFVPGSRFVETTHGIDPVAVEALCVKPKLGWQYIAAEVGYADVRIDGVTYRVLVSLPPDKEPARPVFALPSRVFFGRPAHDIRAVGRAPENGPPARTRRTCPCTF